MQQKVIRITFFILVGILLLGIAFCYVLHRWHQFLPRELPREKKSSTEIREMFRELAREKGVKYSLKNRWVKIIKSKRRLELYSGKTLLKSYKIALGRDPHKDKIEEGDKSTPEGEFYICTKNPKSKFYLFMGISYPNIEDAKRGLKQKLITKSQYKKITSAVKRKKQPLWDTFLGGEIGLHGGGVRGDWTQGCIALDDADIKELYTVLKLRDKVVIEK